MNCTQLLLEHSVSSLLGRFEHAEKTIQVFGE